MEDSTKEFHVTSTKIHGNFHENFYRGSSMEASWKVHELPWSFRGSSTVLQSFLIPWGERVR